MEIICRGSVCIRVGDIYRVTPIDESQPSFPVIVEEIGEEIVMDGLLEDHPLVTSLQGVLDGIDERFSYRKMIPKRKEPLDSQEVDKP